MILTNSIKIKNYKCFDETEQGFDKIYPINIIIGKNNSGKSSLIDLIDYVIKPTPLFINTGRNNKNAEVILSDVIKQNYIDSVFSKTTSGGEVSGYPSYYTYGLTFLNSEIKYVLDVNSNKQIIYFEKPILHNTNGFKTKIEGIIEKPFQGKIFKRILSERDIQIEQVDNNLGVDPNGHGVTNTIRRIINEVKTGENYNNPDLIQKNLLENLNRITRPDIEFDAIVTRDNGNGFWEVYFKNKNNDLVGLSKMGSGLKTVLIVLINLIVIPETGNVSRDNIVFGFEELENNLHPSLQRRLFNYIPDYAKKYNSFFFITTHSSILIDFFGSDMNSQIIHIQNDGLSSTVKTIETHFDGKNVLKDLDYKPSDLLMSNGIIWVEGPSDVLYLELFIDLFNQRHENELKRLNYTIQPLATAIWKYAGFEDFNWDKINKSTQNQIISLEKLNYNHLLVIDNDGNYENLLPSQHQSFSNGNGKNKAMLILESMKNANRAENELKNNFGDTKDGKLFFWVNDGTIETYLKHFISNKGNDFKKYFDLKEERGYFEKKRKEEFSSFSKVQLAVEIGKFCLENNLTLDDFALEDSELFNKIKRLIETIKSWN